MRNDLWNPRETLPAKPAAIKKRKAPTHVPTKSAKKVVGTYVKKPKREAPYVAYLLDAENMLSEVGERLKRASEKASKVGDEDQAGMIAGLQEQLSNMDINLFRILASLKNPELSNHLTIQETPIGYRWKEDEDRETVEIAKTVANLVKE